MIQRPLIILAALILALSELLDGVEDSSVRLERRLQDNRKEADFFVKRPKT